ncbi:hypothetical protein BM1374166_01844 [Bartonella tribocorum]|nr:hypothetical protein BM1374166_01844 [Bartonella tribocorum]
MRYLGFLLWRGIERGLGCKESVYGAGGLDEEG